MIFKIVADKKYLHTTSDLLAFNMALRLSQIQYGMCKYFLPATTLVILKCSLISFAARGSGGCSRSFSRGSLFLIFDQFYSVCFGVVGEEV